MWATKRIQNKVSLLIHTILGVGKFEVLATFLELGQGLLLVPPMMTPQALELTPKLALSLDTAFFGPRQYYFPLLLRFRRLVLGLP